MKRKRSFKEKSGGRAREEEESIKNEEEEERTGIYGSRVVKRCFTYRILASFSEGNVVSTFITEVDVADEGRIRRKRKIVKCFNEEG